MIFYSKNITKSHAIFLLGKVGHASKNIHELFQKIWSYKNGGCFGALVSEISFRRENEYFIYEKYFLDHFGINQRGNDGLRQRGATWVKIKCMPKGLSPTEMI